MEITDITGRVIYTLLDGEQERGEYEIHLSKSEANLPNGIYFVRMIAGNEKYLRKILINE